MRAAALLLLVAGGCYSPRDAFVCASADQCQAGGQAGTCEPDGRCSYADGTCGSGRRYGDAAGALAGLCVGDGEIADAQAGLPDAIVITGCDSHDDCAPITDLCGTGACNTGTGVCDKIAEPDGTTCGDPVCSSFGECGGFDSTCDTSGTHSRSCKPQACSSGACALGGTYSDSQSCSRGTDGISCGGVVCDPFGACNWEHECDESAVQTRACYPQVCAGGGCGNGAPSVETQGCSRETDQQPCFLPCSPQVGVCELGVCLCN